MSGVSKIEWTDASWTPIRARNKQTGKVGWHCEHATTGCVNCYSERDNRRFGTGLSFKPGHRNNIDLFLDDKMLLAPLHWRKPRMIFVCSMTDLFADFVPDAWIDRVFAVMALCPQHTFQLLTKRAERMRQYLFELSERRHTPDGNMRLSPAVVLAVEGLDLVGLTGRNAARESDVICNAIDMAWPLPNVWLGVSCERQEEADERIPHLLVTPAAVRFISAEPLLGPIDLRAVSTRGVGAAAGNKLADCLHWVIVGGESGPKARPMHPDWARSLRDQCAAAGVAFFFKQWGEHEPAELIDDERHEPWRRMPDGSENWAFDELAVPRERLPRAVFRRVGKHRAGRLLDGREHNDMPPTPDGRGG